MENEEIIWESRPSQVLNLGWYMVGIIILISPIILNYGWMAKYISLIIFPFAFWKWLLVRSYKYTLSSERFILQEGIFNLKKEHLELYRVKDYSISTPINLRVFGLSNIILKTSDITNPIIEIKAIKDEEEILKIIRNRVEFLRQLKGVREIDF